MKERKKLRFYIVLICVGIKEKEGKKENKTTIIFKIMN